MRDRLAHELEREVEEVFERKRRELEVDAKLDLHVETVKAPPIVDENVYGEAFPHETPPRVWVQVFPEATRRSITATVCEELAHVKRPDLRHEDPEFQRMLNRCGEIDGGEKRWKKS